MILLIISIGINIKFILENNGKEITNNNVVEISDVSKVNFSENNEMTKVPNSLTAIWTTGSKKGLYHVLEINDDGSVIYTTYNYSYNVEKDNIIIEKYYSNAERYI